jgi:alkaline phosphatase D
MLRRRSLLKSLLAAPLALVPGGWPRGAAPDSMDHGVASGDPRPDAVVLWTRVPEWAQPPAGEGIPVRYEVATSAEFSPAGLVDQGQVLAESTADYTVQVAAQGLSPSTRYYYRFSTDTGYQSVTGRTKTAPAPGELPQALSFAFVSCQNFTQGYYTVLAHLAREQVDFCVHLGDYIYENGHTGSEPGYVREDDIGGGLASDLPTYRQKYRLYLSDPHLREVRRRFPWVVIWDDHEVVNNYAGSELSQTQPQRQRDAYTAFREYMPFQPPTPLSADDPPRLQLYRQLAFGDLLELFASDGRQYRDGVVCERDAVVASCPALEDPERTMLGAAQKGWLQSALGDSRGRWKCILNPVMMMRLALINAPGAPTERLPLSLLRQPGAVEQDVYVNLDAWDGYPAERTALLQFIAEQGLRNVVVCTGDFHNCYAGELRPDFKDAASPAVAVECVGGSVSSFGLTEILGRDLTRLARQVVPQVNPHMQYLDLRYHVYTKVTVAPEWMEIRYMAVETVAQPTSPAFLLQRFIIPNGESRLISP